MKRTSGLLIAVLTALALPVLAQTPSATPGIDQRQANQQRRIDQGVASGQLTPREAARLEKGQRHVQRLEDQAKADGTVTPRERARIKRAQDRQSQQITHEKHDRQHDRNHDGRMDRPSRQR